MPTCSVPGCDRPVRVKVFGLCEAHYRRQRLYGDPAGDASWPRVLPSVPCTIGGCDRPQIARGWCGRHYDKWRRHGDPLTEPPPVGHRIRPCSVEGCDKLTGIRGTAHGLCRGHYTAWRYKTYGRQRAMR